MSLSDDIINYELCFPGAVTGETEVECPYCLELFTLRRPDPTRRWAWGVRRIFHLNRWPVRG